MERRLPRAVHEYVGVNWNYSSNYRGGYPTWVNMAWRAQRARNLGLIGDYPSDYFSESSAESEHSNWESEEEVGDGGRASRPKVRALPRYPRPHSHLLRRRDGQRASGNKHSRRWENCECNLARKQPLILIKRAPDPAPSSCVH